VKKRLSEINEKIKEKEDGTYVKRILCNHNNYPAPRKSGSRRLFITM
jgi:hypothetical protein